jgi:hypothetical protein
VLIEITEDKLRLKLQDLVEKANRATSEKRKAPASNLFTLTVTMCTGTFADRQWFGIDVKGEFLHGIFALATIAVFIWLLKTLRSRETSKSLDQVIAEIKDRSQRQELTPESTTRH